MSEKKQQTIKKTVKNVVKEVLVVKAKASEKVRCCRKTVGDGEGRYFIATPDLESMPNMEIFYLEKPLPAIDPSYTPPTEQSNQLDEVMTDEIVSQN